MDDTLYGTRNKRGDWKPNQPLEVAPILVFPPTPVRFLKWLPSYFFPWHVTFMAMAIIFWALLTPSMETMKTLQFGWVFWILARNLVAVFLFYGFFELRLYAQRKQGTHFKYNPKWPADNKSSVFMFNNQNIDNMIRGFGTGVPIWTAWEVLVLWMFASGNVPWLGFADNIWWLVGFWLLLPAIHETHFFFIHRLIHWPPLYRAVHKVHHNSVNVSPWSSLSMHPVEHLLYFSGVLIHLVLPSHPLLAIYHLHLAGFGAVAGHTGFEKIEVGDAKGVDTHNYAHYLHHKYFEVNYADGMIPWDKWMGTWHDGTAEGDRLMNVRNKKRRAKMAKGATR